MTNQPFLTTLLWLTCLLGSSNVGLSGSLKIATFETEVSPPLNERVGVGFHQSYQQNEHPLLAKGIILEQSDVTYVWCAIDFMGLCNDSYDLFRNRIAEGAETISERVMLSAVHQHTAPALDLNAAKLLHENEPELFDSIQRFEKNTAERIRSCVAAARAELREMSHVASSKALVREVASSRRLRQEDGSIVTRMSRTTDPKLRKAAEGLIDPWLRTIAFYSNDEMVACLHFYACHPQSYYGDGRITWDVPGMARERLQRESGVFQLYFNGCGGDIAMGKYNDGTPAAREALSQRLYDGLVRSVDRLQKQAVENLRWKTSTLKFPLRRERSFSAERHQQLLRSPTATFNQKLKSAMLLAWIDRTKSRRSPIQVQCVSLGPIHLVHLPGEVFVEYQLFAQQLKADEFVAVAAYGECGMWYIGPDTLHRDVGGFEQSWSFGGPVESSLKQSLQDVLSQ